MTAANAKENFTTQQLFFACYTKCVMTCRRHNHCCVKPSAPRDRGLWTFLVLLQPLQEVRNLCLIGVLPLLLLLHPVNLSQCGA